MFPIPSSAAQPAPCHPPPSSQFMASPPYGLTPLVVVWCTIVVNHTVVCNVGVVWYVVDMCDCQGGPQSPVAKPTLWYSTVLYSTPPHGVLL